MYQPKHVFYMAKTSSNFNYSCHRLIPQPNLLCANQHEEFSEDQPSNVSLNYSLFFVEIHSIKNSLN
eukprot:GAHX01000231.1.p3 GENE.GAHX01000231.1~~GAHX01000231.1.p3  ORF type:complete len:67 (-),score=3.92 GAHX01000231.1:576-776(-)